MAAERDWLLGIEVGGTKLQVGLGRADGRLVDLERLRVEPALGNQAILEQIRTGFERLVSRQRISHEQVQAVGVGFGGPVDVASGRIRESFQVPGWTEFPLADWLRQNLGIPLAVIHNDADTAGFAEARLGAGVGFSPLLYLTIGSGIGGALILDGQIYRGAGLGAAEIGHLEIPEWTPDGLRTWQLEEISSGWGIARQASRDAAIHDTEASSDWVVLARAHGVREAITAEFVAEAAGNGDSRALVILDRARRALAFALRQAIALIAPRRIILGGGVSLIGETLWFAPIRRLVEEQVFPPFRGSYDIVPASLGEQVVVHGALALAQDALDAARPADLKSRL